MPCKNMNLLGDKVINGLESTHRKNRKFVFLYIHKKCIKVRRKKVSDSDDQVGVLPRRKEIS